MNLVSVSKKIISGLSEVFWPAQDDSYKSLDEPLDELELYLESEKKADEAAAAEKAKLKRKYRSIYDPQEPSW